MVDEIATGVKCYLTSISKIKLLTPEEEKEVVIKAKTGDAAARNRLITGNLRWVVSIAKTYQGKCSMLSFMDLIQEGNKGLMTAVDKFDPKYGTRFTTYATYWIKQAISKAIAENGRIIRVPANIIALLSKYNKVVAELAQDEGGTPSIKAIATAMQVDEKVVKDLLEYTKDASSLDVTLSDDQDTTIGDLVADEHGEDFLNMTDESLNKEIMRALDSLEPIEKEVIIYRFGIGREKALTLKEVGKMVGKTEERVRQIQNKALLKLRNPVRNRRLKEYL